MAKSKLNHTGMYTKLVNTTLGETSCLVENSTPTVQESLLCCQWVGGRNENLLNNHSTYYNMDVVHARNGVTCRMMWMLKPCSILQ